MDCCRRYESQHPTSEKGQLLKEMADTIGISVDLIKENQKNSVTGFDLFPNPTKNVLNITSKENQMIESIFIFSTTGQEVKHICNVNKEDYTITDMQLSSGLYTVKVSSKNEKTQYLKLIVE